MKKWLLLCLLVFSLQAAEKTICLSMIVKDESLAITRCLASVKPFIDYWVIVDTGSTDGTQKLIKEFLKDIPGELHEQPWVNFGHNRNEALKLAKGKADYSLFIDADEVLEGSIDKAKLSNDLYTIAVRISTTPLMTFQRAFLVSSQLDWYWKGVIHETINCPQKFDFALLSTVTLSAEATDGRRSQDPEKHLKDIKVLEQALAEDPTNFDYVYYLAQSYYNQKNFPLALKYYRKRAQMGGWDEHIFWSKYISGQLLELLKMGSEEFIDAYCEAFQYRPTRAEPLFRMAQHFCNQKDFILSYLLAKFGLTIPPSTDIVYVEDWIYSYGLLTLFADSAFQLGKKEEALDAYKKIARNEKTPEELRNQALLIVKTLEEKQNPAKL